ncbi:nuclease domain-containing protein [Liquorilactobacillus satsumensis]|uniref:nuclease domain-containing protein n=1 Tax=Liquorilactobacillus satsumensis TaxID=259059 RepID=UPI0039ED4DB5
MDLQDKVSLISQHGNRTFFEFSENKFDYSNIFLSIKENVNYRLEFTGESKDKLYIDGLDLIDTEQIQHDAKGKLFIYPNTGELVLYDYKKNNEHKYLPGIYRLKLVTASKSTLYSWLKVSPKFITENELESMKMDVEKKVEGLARTFDANTNGTLTNYSFELTTHDIATLQVLHERKLRFTRSVYDVSNCPRTIIGNKYRWSCQLNNAIDSNGIKKMASRPDKKKQVYSKKHNISFISKENMALKQNLRLLKQIISKLKIKIDKYIEYSEIKYTSDRQETLKNDLCVLAFYCKNIDFLLKQSWLKDVPSKEINFNNSNSSAMLNQSYLFFHELVWKLKHNSHLAISFHRQYSYYWHRTDLLYEIWGYIKVLDVMQQMGFQPISGWIFKKGRKSFEPLEPGTTVVMRNSKEIKYARITAKIIYTKEINLISPEKTSEANPLWRNTPHRVPDIRIDLYDEDNILLNVFILDTKYRKLESVVASGKEGSWQQIAAYSDSIKSLFPFNTNKYRWLKGILPPKYSIVGRTSILFPGLQNAEVSEKLVQKTMRREVIPIELRPGFGDEKLKRFLKNGISEIVERLNNWEQIKFQN